jgi:hypothetical protein
MPLLVADRGLSFVLRLVWPFAFSPLLAYADREIAFLEWEQILRRPLHPDTMVYSPPTPRPAQSFSSLFGAQSDAVEVGSY